MSEFGKRWLSLWCAGAVLFGLVLVGVAWESTQAPALALVRAFGGDPSLALSPALRFGLGLQGALTIGWVLSVLAVVRSADLRGDAGRTLWRGILAAVTAWFVLDTAISIVTGFWPNGVSNLFIWVTFVAGVLASGVLRPVDGTVRAA